MNNVSHVLQGCKVTAVKTGRNYRKTRCLDKHKEKEHEHLHNSSACKTLTKTNFEIRWAKGRFRLTRLIVSPKQDN